MCTPELTSAEILALPKCWHVDETGWLIAGHGLAVETIKNAMSHMALDHFPVHESVADYDTHPAELYRAREVWVRKFNQPKGGDYSWLMQETEPHARGAGRFTLVDQTLCGTCPKPHSAYEPHPELETSA